MAQISGHARLAVALTAAASVASTVALAGPAHADVNWDAIAQCESGGNWRINTGNGYHGGLQFSPRTWRAYGGGKYGRTANQASRAEQIRIAERVLDGQGIGAWPTCGRKARSTKRFKGTNTARATTRKTTAVKTTAQRQAARKTAARKAAARNAAARKATASRSASREAASRAAARETTVRAASRAAARQTTAARAAAARARAAQLATARSRTWWGPAVAVRLSAARKAALDAATWSPALQTALTQAVAMQAAAHRPRAERSADGPQLSAHVIAADRQPAYAAPARDTDGPQLHAHLVDEPGTDAN